MLQVVRSGQRMIQSIYSGVAFALVTTRSQRCTASGRLQLTPISDLHAACLVALWEFYVMQCMSFNELLSDAYRKVCSMPCAGTILCSFPCHELVPYTTISNGYLP
ncbi:unnamed protein product [Discosporangium mesarthrocarpum]